MKISNNRPPFVYKNKFELQMFELRTEFEQLFAKQQRREHADKLFKRKLVRDVAYSYVKPYELAKYLLNNIYKHD